MHACSRCQLVPAQPALRQQPHPALLHANATSSTAACPQPPPPAGDGIEEDEAAAALGLPYVRVLLAPAEHYPAERVASWRPDAVTSGAGLPFTQLTTAHIAAAAGLSGAEDAAAGEAAAEVPPASDGGEAAAAAATGT